MSILASFLLLLLPQGPTLAQLDAMRDEHRSLLNAIAFVESSNHDDAIGDNGKALGAFQLWRVYWTDALEFAPCIGGEYKDVCNRVYAERCVVAYMARYAKVATDQNMARIHNGGPKGAKSRATVKYWKKVELRLQSSGKGV